MIAHKWVNRAKCSCGYVWTTEGSPNVVCACGKTQILDDILSGGEDVTDEVEFKNVVATDLGCTVDELILLH